MTIVTNEITDLNAIEDAIESWILAATDFPTFDDRPSVHWEGYDLERKRPYILITPISQPNSGRAWSKQLEFIEDDVIKLKTKYWQSFEWSLQFGVFTDAYDNDGKAIRETAYRYLSRLVSRAQFPTISRILDNVNLSYHPRLQEPLDRTMMEQDKYIHHAVIEYLFSGVFITEIIDDDYFNTVENAEINLS